MCGKTRQAFPNTFHVATWHVPVNVYSAAVIQLLVNGVPNYELFQSIRVCEHASHFTSCQQRYLAVGVDIGRKDENLQGVLEQHG